MDRQKKSDATVRQAEFPRRTSTRAHRTGVPLRAPPGFPQNDLLMNAQVAPVKDALQTRIGPRERFPQRRALARGRHHNHPDHRRMQRTIVRIFAGIGERVAKPIPGMMKDDSKSCPTSAATHQPRGDVMGHDIFAVRPEYRVTLRNGDQERREGKVTNLNGGIGLNHGRTEETDAKANRQPTMSGGWPVE